MLLDLGKTRDDLGLWIPSSSPHLVDQYVQSMQAIDDFLALDLTPNDFLETLAANGINIDDYLDVIEYNLNH